MITEYTYSAQDLKKRCFGCKYLALDKYSDIIGDCVCVTNKVKNRSRSVTDKACSYKNYTPATPEKEA